MARAEIARAQIDAEVRKVLAECGISSGVVSWSERPARLRVLVDCEIRSIDIGTRITKRQLKRELEKLESWGRLRQIQRMSKSKVPA